MIHANKQTKKPIPSKVFILGYLFLPIKNVYVDLFSFSVHKISLCRKGRSINTGTRAVQH